MKQQLYINGVAVDMPAEQIKFKVSSNIFEEVSKISTAHSYTTTLPRTAKNDRLFALAHIPAATSGGLGTHKRLEAKLFVDGVSLFREGYCYVTAVDYDGFKVQLYWGLLEILAAIKEEDLKLWEMPLSDGWKKSFATYITLAKTNAKHQYLYDDIARHVSNGDLDDDSKERANTYPWQMPTIAAADIVNKIEQVYGLSLSWGSVAAAMRDSLYHVLTQRRSLIEGELFGYYMHATYYQVDNKRANMATSANYSTSDERIFKSLINVEVGSDGLSGSFTPKQKFTAKKVRIHGRANPQFGFTVSVTNSNYETTTFNATYDSTDQCYHIDETLNDWEFGPREYSAMSVEIRGNATGSDVDWKSLDNIICQVEVEVIVDKIETDLKIGDPWCYERNYPDLKILDYLNELAVRSCGYMVGSITKPSQVRIMALNDILAQPSQVINILGVKSVEFTMGDLAQKNIYSHDENDDETPSYYGKGSIFVNDDTLERETEAFESAFKIPKGNGVHMWKIEKQSDGKTYTANFDARGDYIGGYDYAQGALRPVKYFGCNGMDFDTLTRGELFAKYAEIVKHPKVVAVTAQLGVLELLNLDMGAPVFVPQLGRRYLIKELKTDNGDNYELTLVQI